MPHPSSRFRPALLPVNHPLAHHTLAKPTVKWLQPGSVNEKLITVWEQQQITNLVSDYMYILDAIMVDPTNARVWEKLFTDDCEVTYPFGTHYGKAGMAQFCLNAETRFARMMHLSTNIVIRFPEGEGNQARGELLRVAHGRSNLYTACGLDEKDLNQNFQEGGWYYWSFRKEDDGQWKISHLFLDVNWTVGKNQGLTAGHHNANMIAGGHPQVNHNAGQPVNVNTQLEHAWNGTQWNNFAGMTFEGNSYSPPASTTSQQANEQQWMDPSWTNNFADTFAGVTSYRKS